VLLAVIIVLLVIIGVLVARQQRSRQLKENFGPEYRRAVAEHGDQRSAERELSNRQPRLDEFEIRPLEPAVRERYSERWRAAQRNFVDEPTVAVSEAHELVQQVMGDRGYPVDQDFEQRALTYRSTIRKWWNYRAANAISGRAGNGDASTEQLRQSMVHFRHCSTICRTR
jgi:hypothetical protein